MDAVGLVLAACLSLFAVGGFLVAEWRRPRRRATDPALRHRVSSLLDRTP
ncbi:MAG TPA: hypothetical protein VFU19_12045 [Iamia sp.]|nr:hypothetical protein [Iamia sp.]